MKYEHETIEIQYIKMPKLIHRREQQIEIRLPIRGLNYTGQHIYAMRRPGVYEYLTTEINTRMDMTVPRDTR